MSNTYWFNRAVCHLEIVQQLLDRSIGRESLWDPAMTVAEAIRVEKRNVVYCLAQIS